jgi:hypothetical protein
VTNGSGFHHFRSEIINYWHGFGKRELIDMLTVYDIKEKEASQIELSNIFYAEFHEVCVDAYQHESPTDEYTEALIRLCNKLPTALMMYFMQNINKKNSTLFQQVYQKLSSDRGYVALHKRCMAFEKNLILARVCSESRLSSIEATLSKMVDEDYAD